MIEHNSIPSLVGRSNATIIEVGANDGRDTVKLADLFPLGRVFAFEPDPRAIQRFKERIDRSNISLIEVAVGAVNSRVQFFQSNGQWPGSEEDRKLYDLPSDWDMSGSIRRPKAHFEEFPWCKFDSTIEVPIVTLDAWSKESGVSYVDFIWADVQGAEEDLIQGALETLKKTKYIYTEFSDKEMYEGELNLEKICNLLTDFEVIQVFEHDVLLKNKGGIIF